MPFLVGSFVLWSMARSGRGRALRNLVGWPWPRRTRLLSHIAVSRIRPGRRRALERRMNDNDIPDQTPGAPPAAAAPPPELDDGGDEGDDEGGDDEAAPAAGPPVPGAAPVPGMPGQP